MAVTDGYKKKIKFIIVEITFIFLVTAAVEAVVVVVYK